MSCQICDDLFAGYNFADKRYTQAMQNMAGLAGDDFKLAVEELERLRVTCQDANHALMEHWLKDHRHRNQSQKPPWAER